MFCDHSLKYKQMENLKVKGGKISSPLNPDTNTSMLFLKSKICNIINSSMNIYLYFAYNVVL